MRPAQWAREEVSQHLWRQLQSADAEDAKTGLVLAFVGAVLVGALSVPHLAEPGVSFAGASVALSVEALAFALLALFPRRYDDPPDPVAFSDDVLTNRYEEEFALRALIRFQLAAIEHNDRILRGKVASQVIAGTFAVGATVMLLLEAAVS